MKLFGQIIRLAGSAWQAYDRWRTARVYPYTDCPHGVIKCDGTDCIECQQDWAW